MSSKSTLFVLNAAKLATGTPKPLLMASTVYEDKSHVEGESKTPIIVMHGFLGSARNWSGTCKRLLRALTVKRKLIAVDMRNHGESPHDPQHNYTVMTGDVSYFLEQLRVKRASFIGHSMGGAAAMVFALTYVSKVRLGKLGNLDRQIQMSNVESTMLSVSLTRRPNYWKKLLGRRDQGKSYGTTGDGVKPLRLSYTVYDVKEETPHKITEPIVILHGVFGSKLHWAEVAKKLTVELRPRRRILAVDLRNHGDSPHAHVHNYAVLTEDVRGFVEGLRVPTVTFLGYSMGGKVAMAYTLKYPDAVSQLIVGDIAPIKYPQTRLLDYIVDAMLEVKLPTNVDRMTATVIVNKQLRRRIQSEETRSFLLMNLAPNKDGSYRWKCNLPVLKENIGNVLTFPETKAVFKKPVLFVAGSESELIRHDDEPAIKARFPNAQIVRLEGAKHNIHIDKPNEFVEVCVKYLNNE